MKTMTTLRIGLLFLLAILGTSCGMTSGSYVQEMTGYSVTEGRIEKINNMATDKVEPLKDGVALTLSQQGCSVEIRFVDDKTKVFDLGPGVIIVHGYDKDYILQNVSHIQSGRDPTGSPSR